MTNADLEAHIKEALAQPDTDMDYAIALQRAIEWHCKGKAVPPEVAARCPHHAEKLNKALALAQPAQQEPVGDEWTPCMKLPVVVHVRKQRRGETHVSTREGITPVRPDDLIMRGVSGEEYPIGRAIFEQTYSLETAPPAQRTWVGLTDEEIKEIVGPYGDMPIKGYTRKLVDQIEAKLREKNQ